MFKAIPKKLILLTLIVVVVFSSFVFTSCKARLVYEDGVFYCAANKITYEEVDFQYLPVAVSTEKFGELNENGTKTDIFSIENASSDKWLATSDGRLFCAVGEKIPTLDELEVNKIFICREGSGMTISLAEITSAESIKTILDSIGGLVTVEYPEKGEATDLLTLRCSSSLYPWLYYNISYILKSKK